VTRLAGKWALVTGGGSGIGKAVALAFAAQGAKVAVMGRRLEKLQEVTAEVRKRGGKAVEVVGDVAKAADAERAVRETVEKLGGLNVLVNNAGMLSVATVETVPEEEWDRVMTTNLKGPFLMSRAALPALRKAGGGAIVNIGSILGLIAMKDRAAYCASKGGVTLLTKAMALDHAHEKIRVNCICPSLVETELVQGLFASAAGAALKQARVATLPLGRMGKPEDVAEMAVFLASDEASWVTGTAIPLDGGLSAY
jgi:NAD(P)-dependent dehydrogenase (short-subunit alcohol dehydrogenase family)